MIDEGFYFRYDIFVSCHMINPLIEKKGRTNPRDEQDGLVDEEEVYRSFRRMPPGCCSAQSTALL
jgi:hypothetical protein